MTLGGAGILIIYSLHVFNSAIRAEAVGASDKVNPVLSLVSEDQDQFTKLYTMHVVGEQHEGRQPRVQRVRVGMPVTLKREPDNQFDENAVLVIVNGIGDVGYLSRSNAEWVAGVIDDGAQLTATVAKVFSDTYNGETFLNIMIDVDGVPLSSGSSGDVPVYVPVTPFQKMQDMLEEASIKKTLNGQARWYQKAIDMADQEGARVSEPVQLEKIRLLRQELVDDLARSKSEGWGKKLMPQRWAGADAGIKEVA